MRTTLELDDDLLVAARELARRQGATLGEVISALARRSLPAQATAKYRNGVRLFTPKPDATPPDLDLVNRLRDGE